jgi:hypothetical protein
VEANGNLVKEQDWTGDFSFQADPTTDTSGYNAMLRDKRQWALFQRIVEKDYGLVPRLKKTPGGNNVPLKQDTYLNLAVDISMGGATRKFRYGYFYVNTKNLRQASAGSLPLEFVDWGIGLYKYLNGISGDFVIESLTFEGFPDRNTTRITPIK